MDDEKKKIDKFEKLNVQNSDYKDRNKVVSDSESVNHGPTPHTNNVNMPNTIKYPKGGSINNPTSQIPNVSLTNNVNNNYAAQTHNKDTNTQGNDEADGKGKRKISGRLLISLIAVVIIYEYFTYVFKLKPILMPSHEDFSLRLVTLVFYHIILFMMIWSFIVTIRTIPGFIPLYWGFYIGDEEYKRKRYCLICNAFKPERSHHCSVCNICVLNMDHHCPWVNNCIGFYNRKFFMQLLFYLLVLLWYILLTCLPNIYEIVKHCYATSLHLQEDKIIDYLIILPAYIIVGTLTVLNTMFFRYHIMLVLNNSTTIESLDPENKENTKFKLSNEENWAQVFGFDVMLWFLPVFSESGRPHGDGLNWKLNSAYEMNLNNSQLGKDSQSGLPNYNNRTNQSISQYQNRNYNSNYHN